MFKKNCFSVITKNFKLKILTKNLVAFKRWDGLKEKNYYYGVHWKIWFLGEIQEKTYLGGDYLKKGAWTVCRLKGCGKKEVGGVFEGS